MNHLASRHFASYHFASNHLRGRRGVVDTTRNRGALPGLPGLLVRDEDEALLVLTALATAARRRAPRGGRP